MDAYTLICHHMKTLAATSSPRPNSETLVACEVLAHPCVALHPYMCGACGGSAVVVAALIGYDDVEFVAGLTTRRSRSWLTTSSILTYDYVESLL
jgi:hypothetical protein